MIITKSSASVTTKKNDILDADFLGHLISDYKPDSIIHLAALTKTWFTGIRELFEVNLLGTVNLYNAVLKLRENEDYNPKILYISTSEIYGNTPNPKNITENSLLNPTNPYSSSKAAADRASYAYGLSKNLSIAILRPFTHTGPGQSKGFFIPDMASQIARIEKADKGNGLLVGNLETTRDYLDVRDVVAAYKDLMEAEWEKGEVFNICSGRGVKMKTLLRDLLKLSNATIKVKKDPGRFRPIDMPVYIGNSDKIRKLTGWKPKIEIDKTLEDTLNYWREKEQESQSEGSGF